MYEYPDVCTLRVQSKTRRIHRVRRACCRYGPLAVHDALYILLDSDARQYRHVVTHIASGHQVAGDLTERAAHDLAARLSRLRCWGGPPETIVGRFTPHTRALVVAAIGRATRASEEA